MSWRAVEWAMTKAPLPKSDPPARAVLGYLAAKADGDGRNAYPLALSMAHDLTLSPAVVPRILKRLIGYGLISKDGVGPQGQPKWVLHLDRCHPDGSFEAFCEQHRGRESDRKSRYRERKLSRTVDAGQSRSESAGQAGSVPHSQSSCPASTVVVSRTDSASVPHSQYPQRTPKTTTSPREHPPAAAAAETALPLDGVPPPAPPAPADTGGAFERFWQAYPRRVGKKTAEKAFTKAVKDGTDLEVLIAGAERYAVSRRGQDVRYTAHPTTWLNAGRWDDEPEPAPGASGHTPYRDPDDQSIYDEPL